MDFPKDLPYTKLATADMVESDEAAANHRGAAPGQLTPPPEFGPLYEVQVKDRLGKGVHERVYLRQNTGTRHYGVPRGNGEHYEHAKFNILLHPTQGCDRNNAKYQDERAKVSNLGSLSKSILFLKHWPAVPGSCTIAPFIESPAHGFRKPQHPQCGSALVRVLGITELSRQILGRVATDWEALSNLGRASQRSFLAVKAHWTHFDLTGYDFWLPTRTGKEVEALVEAGKATREEASVGLRVNPTVVFSPVRQQFRNDEFKQECVQADGTYLDPEFDWGCLSMKDTAEVHLGMLALLTKRPRGIHHLILQRCPFVTVDTVRALVSWLPDLSALSVHSCELLNLGDTPRLLQVVADANAQRAREGGRRPPIELDFYPRYYQGPRVSGRGGCYGVAWEDDGVTWQISGVVSVLLRVIPFARRHGMADTLTRPGKAFRRWLDKVPFPLGSLERILETIHRLDDLGTGGFDDAIDRRHVSATTTTTHRPHQYSGSGSAGALFALRRDMELTLWYELVIATAGTRQDHSALRLLLLDNSPRHPSRDKTRDEEERIHLTPCGGCGVPQPASFYTRQSLHRAPELVRCMGCQLVGMLAGQQDVGFAVVKRRMVAGLWSRSDSPSSPAVGTATATGGGDDGDGNDNGEGNATTGGGGGDRITSLLELLAADPATGLRNASLRHFVAEAARFDREAVTGTLRQLAGIQRRLDHMRRRQQVVDNGNDGGDGSVGDGSRRRDARQHADALQRLRANEGLLLTRLGVRQRGPGGTTLRPAGVSWEDRIGEYRSKVREWARIEKRILSSERKGGAGAERPHNLLPASWHGRGYAGTGVSAEVLQEEWEMEREKGRMWG